MASFQNIPWRGKIRDAVEDCKHCKEAICPDSCAETRDTGLDAVIDAIRAEGEEKGRESRRIRKHDYAGRFEDPTYCKVIEELARIPWEQLKLPGVSLNDMMAGARELVAQMFGQSYNTVMNDAWQWQHEGVHDPRTR